METLIQAVRIYRHDLGMEFGKEKYATLVLKSGKRHITDGMELENQDKITTFREKEMCKWLGILETDTFRQENMKEKIKKEYFRKAIKLLEIKLYSRNVINEINTWAVPTRKVFGIILKVDQRST